jgi:hypothetical protein
MLSFLKRLWFGQRTQPARPLTVLIQRNHGWLVEAKAEYTDAGLIAHEPTSLQSVLILNQDEKRTITGCPDWVRWFPLSGFTGCKRCGSTRHILMHDGTGDQIPCPDCSDLNRHASTNVDPLRDPVEFESPVHCYKCGTFQATMMYGFHLDGHHVWMCDHCRTKPKAATANADPEPDRHALMDADLSLPCICCGEPTPGRWNKLPMCWSTKCKQATAERLHSPAPAPTTAPDFTTFPCAKCGLNPRSRLSWNWLCESCEKANQAKPICSKCGVITFEMMFGNSMDGHTVWVCGRCGCEVARKETEGAYASTITDPSFRQPPPRPGAMCPRCEASYCLTCAATKFDGDVGFVWHEDAKAWMRRSLSSKIPQCWMVDLDDPNASSNADVSIDWEPPESAPRIGGS